MWTQQEIEALRRMYPDTHISPEQMEEYFGQSWQILRSKACNIGLSRASAGTHTWVEEDIATLSHMYPDLGIPPERMEQYFGRSWKAIRLKAWKLGLNRARPVDDQIHHTYFHEIATQEQAYWLGWLASDGHITVWNRGHYICLQLQARDESIIRRFIHAVAPGATIYWDRKAVGVRIGSKEMFHDLVAQGVGPDKTKNFIWPRSLPEKFAMDFLLGYFDGDGCLGQYNYGGEIRLHWVLLGTKAFLTLTKEHIQNFVGVELREPTRAHKNKSPHLYKIRSSSRKVIHNLDAALNRSGLGLPRKHL
jgi:hypothetical protein